jgi:hypothetical protein
MRIIFCAVLIGGPAVRDVLAQTTVIESDARATLNTAVAQQVMAAYLYKFGNYIEWPEEVFANTSSPITIGVVDAPELADELKRMVKGRTVGGRHILIRRLEPDDPKSGVNVLFIGGSDTDHLAAVLAEARTQPILTVTTAENGLDQGSIINFVVVDGKLRFEVSEQAAGESKLNISARLLIAAHKVETGLL